MSSKQGKDADLRVCARCEWIFKKSVEHDFACPKCHFASYSARWVYDNKCYRYAESQKPWLDRKITSATCKFQSIINDYNKNIQRKVRECRYP